MTSESNGTLLLANVDRRPLLQRGLVNFQPYNESLKDWSPRKQLILFESQCFPQLRLGETLRFSGNNINCFPRDQSLSVYYARGVPKGTELHGN